MLRFLLPLMLADSGIQLPLAGYLETNQGWVELLGVRGNFLTGERLPDGVLSAGAFEGVRVWKTEQELVARAGEAESRIGVPQGPAWFALHANSIYAWLPASRDLYRWDATGWRSVAALSTPADTLGFAASQGKLLLLTAQGETWFELTGVFAAERTDSVAAPATLDAYANRWTADGATVSCGGYRWTLDAPVTSLQPQGQGWIIASHGDRRTILRCDSEEATLLPAP